MVKQRLVAALVTAMLALGGAAVAVTATAGPAQADGCYTWTRNLVQGHTGEDVRQLQIRVAGWAGYDVRIDIDGNYGPQTANAVSRFQSAFGLSVDGKAGSETFGKIYALQDNDCTPVNFTIEEASANCGKGTAGMPTSVRNNLIRGLWRAQALRQRLGNNALNISSGWRDAACNASVGGASNSKHLTGEALDFVSGPHFSLCDIARAARYTGFGQIYGPGYPGHNDHIHAGLQAGRSWSAPSCVNFP